MGHSGVELRIAQKALDNVTAAIEVLVDAVTRILLRAKHLRLSVICACGSCRNCLRVFQIVSIRVFLGVS